MFGNQASQSSGIRQSAKFTDQRADAASKLQRATRTISLPERHFARLSRCRHNQNAIMSDVLYAPSRCTQYERLARVRLEDHLLIEFAHTHRFAFSVSQKNAVK